MKENNKITLENNDNYIILDKLHYDGDVYYFCIKTGSKEKVMQDKIKFFLEKSVNNEYFLAEVKNKKVLSKLINIVRNFS